MFLRLLLSCYRTATALRSPGRHKPAYGVAEELNLPIVAGSSVPSAVAICSKKEGVENCWLEPGEDPRGRQENLRRPGDVTQDHQYIFRHSETQGTRCNCTERNTAQIMPQVVSGVWASEAATDLRPSRNPGGGCPRVCPQPHESNPPAWGQRQQGGPYFRPIHLRQTIRCPSSKPRTQVLQQRGSWDGTVGGDSPDCLREGASSCCTSCKYGGTDLMIFLRDPPRSTPPRRAASGCPSMQLNN